jgi:ATP-binding cassette, subfamily B, bacterial
MLPRVVRLLAPHRGKVALLSASILVSAALGVAAPFLTKYVFDDALFPPEGEPNLELLAVLVTAIVLLIALGGLAGILQTYLASVVGQLVMHDLRDRLYAHLQRMSLRFFTSTRTGEIQSRIANDVGGIGDVVSKSAAVLVASTVYMVTATVAMAILSWELTLLSLAILPVFLYVSYRVGKVQRRIAASTQETLAEMSTITQETLSVSGALLSKVFEAEGKAAERYRAESRRLADLRIRQELIARIFMGLAQTFFLVAPVLVYLGAGLAMSGGSSPITAGTLVAFTALQTRLYLPLRDVLDSTMRMQASGALFERVFQYLDLPHEIADAPGARPLPRDRVRGEVAFRNVSFRYAAAEAGTNGSRVGREWSLDDVSLEVEPGQLAALVGPSGAGKTTLSYLLARLYDVERGSVQIDGTDVRQIRLASLSELIGMVTQETYLFHASIRDNLLYARPEATAAEVESAARHAYIHERICELDEGYETIVGERGYRLSGGEKQRLAIARVILKDPRILILDEATSSLDTESERLVQSALEELTTARTTIAIAHRLSTILAADVIFVLDRGRLVERGTHADLLAEGGLYARLYEQQFQGGLLEARCEDGVVLSSGDVVETAPAEA